MSIGCYLSNICSQKQSRLNDDDFSCHNQGFFVFFDAITSGSVVKISDVNFMNESSNFCKELSYCKMQNCSSLEGIMHMNFLLHDFYIDENFQS